MKRPTKRNYLGEWRDRAGLNQDQLAKAVGSSKATISRLETGERGLSQKWLERLAPVLEATPAELLSAPGDSQASTGVSVPLIDSVQAGKWKDVSDPYPKGDAVKWIAVLRRHGPRAFALTLDGPSMLPEYHDGDIIVVDPDVEARPGDDVVARQDDENVATFKRLRIKGYDAKGRPQIELVPLNPDWPVLTMKASGRIVGPAMEVFRRLR